MPATSSNADVRLMRAAAWAALFAFLLNALSAVLLEPLLAGGESTINDMTLLERRLEAFPAKERVRVLLLGNSHVVAGLRPPDLAEALGLEPDEVFSLAVPAATATETALLLERHLARFPAARLAICGVDALFLGFDDDMRVRYLTRQRIDQRLAYAMRASTVEEGVTRLAGWFFPIADFGEPLAERLWHRLAVAAGREPPGREATARRLSRIPFRWGYPPPWDHPLGFGEHERRTNLLPGWIRQRVRLYGQAAGRADRGLAELPRLRALLEARGCRLVLAEMPKRRLLATLLDRQRPATMRAYEQRLAAYRAASDLAWIEAPRGWADEAFFDLDHLAPEGARRLAAEVAAALPPVR